MVCFSAESTSYVDIGCCYGVPRPDNLSADLVPQNAIVFKQAFHLPKQRFLYGGWGDGERKILDDSLALTLVAGTTSFTTAIF